MTVQVQEITPIKKRMQATVAAEDVTEAVDHAYEEINKKVNLKGFRPGKIPRQVLEQHYQKDAEGMAVQYLLDTNIPGDLEDAGIVPVAPPEVSIVQFERGKEFIYAALVEVKPVFEVKDYEGLRLTKTKIEIDKKEIENQLEGLRHRYATLIPFSEPRPIRNGDVVVIDYRGFLEGKPLDKKPVENYTAELGRGFLLPGFEEALFKMNKGDAMKIPVTFPADYRDKRFAGKTVEYEVTLKDVKEKKLPNLDDELAKDVGNIKDLKELRGKIEEELTRGKEQIEKNKMRRQIVDLLAEKNAFDLPDGMVQRELEGMFSDFEWHLKSQGVVLEEAGVSKEEFFIKNKDDAVKSVRGYLIFEALGKQLAIEVTPEELEKKFQEAARIVRQPLPVLRKYYHEKNLFPQLEEQVRQDKTLDYIIEKAKIKVEKGRGK